MTRRRELERPLVEWAAFALLAVACMLPLVAVGADLMAAGAGDRLRSTLGEGRTWWLLGRTLAMAAAVTAGALLIGVPAGLLLGHSDLIGRRVAFWLHGFGLSLPPFVLALGWFHLLGTGGAWGTAAGASLLFGPAGVVAVLTLALAPVITGLTVLGLWGIDPSLEEAGLVAARPWRVARAILLPLAWRSIAFGGLLVFALALSEIGVPMFLGMRTYPAAVFTRLGGIVHAPGEAFALVLPLLVVGAALLFADRAVGAGAVESLGLRGHASRPLPLGRARVPLSLLCWLGILVSLLPLFALAFRAGVAGLAEAAGWVGASGITSLLTSAGAAGVVLGAGVIVAHARLKGRFCGWAGDVLTVIAFLTPSAVLGVGLIAIWNRPGLQAVYASAAILVIGLVAKYAVIGVRGAAAVLSQASPHGEEAAVVFGSGYLRRMTRIVWPMRARALAGVGLLACVAALRDLDTVVMFYPPGHEPFLVRLFTLEANGPEPVVAALALYQVAATAVLLLAAGRWLRRGEGLR